jgi:ABC-type sugar transport system substrate-binding protein
MKRLVIGLAAAFLVLTPAAAQQPPARPQINTLREMGEALWSCWSPPPDTQNFQVTIRFSFKRDGQVLGKPRITYSTFNGDVSEQRIIMSKILDSLDECTPLNVTSELGGAIAGRIFTMTFTSPSTES